MAQAQLPDWLGDEPAEIRPILLELRHLRRIGIDGLKRHLNATPIILEVGERLYSSAQRNSQYVIVRKIFGEKILPAFDGDEAVGVLIYFNYNENYGEGSAVKRRELAAVRFGQNVGKFREPIAGKERLMLIKIAALIGTLRQELDREQPKRNNKYVRRSDLHRQISEAISRHPVVALVGEGGTGKTTLARGFANESSDRNRVIFVRAHNEGVLFSDMLIALRGIGIDISQVATIQHALIRANDILAHDPDIVDFLIIDNIDSWELVEPLLSSKICPKVLVTSRSEILPKNIATCVAVGSFTSKEVRALIFSRLPDATEDEVASLTSLLKGRAVVIDHVCSLLATSPEYRDGVFLDTLNRELVSTLDDVAGHINQTALTTVYRQIIAALESRDETVSSVWLLELIAFTSGQDIPVDVLRYGMASIKGGSIAPDARADLAYGAASHVLLRHHLIVVADEKVAIHPLTRESMQYIFSGDGRLICSLLLSKYAAHFWQKANGSTDTMILSFILQQMAGVEYTRAFMYGNAADRRRVSAWAAEHTLRLKSFLESQLRDLERDEE